MPPFFFREIRVGHFTGVRVIVKGLGGILGLEMWDEYRLKDLLREMIQSKTN
jgi:hypothetical protein